MSRPFATEPEEIEMCEETSHKVHFYEYALVTENGIVEYFEKGDQIRMIRTCDKENEQCIQVCFVEVGWVKIVGSLVSLPPPYLEATFWEKRTEKV